MSGLRAARHLRSDTAIALLKESDRHFAETFQKLKGKLKQTKQTQALTQHQLAWKKEALNLAKQRKQLESELTTLMVNLIGEKKVSLQGGGTDQVVQSLADELKELEEERVKLQQETRAKAREYQAAIRRASTMLQVVKQEKWQPTTSTSNTKASTATGSAKKKKSVGFSVQPSSSEMKSNATPSSTSSSAPPTNPLTTFLSNFLTNAAITEQQLAAEEHNLVQQLLLIEGDLERFERPIEIDQTNGADESPLVELAEKEEIEPEEEEKEPTEPSSTNRTFLTADALSPRYLTRRTYRSTTGALISLTQSVFPSLPEPDPTLTALPQVVIDQAQTQRSEQWQEAADEMKHDLDQRFEQNLYHLREAFHVDTSKIRQMIEESDRVCGWTSKHQARFQSIQSSYKVQGAKYAQLLDRLKLEFKEEMKQVAKLSSASTSTTSSTTAATPVTLCLAERIDFSERLKAYKIQRAALEKSWAVERHAFIEHARQELLAFDRAYVREYQHLLEVEQHQAQQHQLHEELSVLREEKAAKDALEAEAAAAKKQQEEAEAQVKAEKEQAIRERQRRLLQLYHEHLAAEQGEVARQAELDAAVLAEEQRLALEAAKPKVERRRELLQQKREAQHERDEARRAMDAAREARLEAMRQLVAPNVERDPERVLQPTAASSAEVEEVNPLFAVHGYDMSTLLKDKRFRLQLALWTAGVSQSSYAKELVMNTAPAQQPRPDMRSTVFPTRPM